MDTKILKKENYIELVKSLLHNNVVGFPTDTVYGLGIVYDSKEAFDKLYEIKQRSITKPISMMAYSKDEISEVAFIDDRSKKAIDKLMPGALTIILTAKDNLPSHVTFNYPTIGIRIPTNKIALDILKECKKPLLVTSANISGKDSLNNYEDVYECFNGNIDCLISENSISGVASTVVDVRDGIKILREGPISKEMIERVINDD